MEQETNPVEFSNQEDRFDIDLSKRAAEFLLESYRWTNFIAIVGFVLIGLGLIFSFSIGGIMNSAVSANGMNNVPSWIGVFYSVMMVITSALYFFPCLYLFKFAKHGKLAVSTKNSEDLTFSLENLKSFFKFMGVMTLIVVVLYGLMFLIGMVGAAFS